MLVFLTSWITSFDIYLYKSDDDDDENPLFQIFSLFKV